MQLAGYDSTKNADDFYYDDTLPLKVIDFIETFCVHSVGSKGGELVILEDWQKVLLHILLGWNDKETDLRRYRKMWLEIPKKNGKSFLIACLFLYFIVADDEHSPNLLLAANSKTQTENVYDAIRGFVAYNDELKQILNCQEWTIKNPSNNGKIVRCPSNAKSSDGKNSNIICVDEIHEYVEADISFLAKMKHAGTSREQPLFIVTTTAGDNKFSPAYQEKMIAEKIRDGILINPSYLPLIWSAPDSIDWTKIENYHQYNPNINISFPQKHIEEMIVSAQQNPREIVELKRYHLNCWCIQESKWLNLKKYDACNKKTSAKIKGIPSYYGVDFSSTTDLTAVSVATPLDNMIYIQCYFFIPCENIKKKSKIDNVPYELWAADPKNNVIISDGNCIDYDLVTETIKQIAIDYPCRELAYDKWNAVPTILSLQDAGFNCVAHGQGFANFNQPSKQFERLILTEQINFGDNDCLRWNASNVNVASNAEGSIKPIKKDYQQSSNRIDGIIATIQAVGRALHSEKQKSNPYDNAGLFSWADE